MQRVELANLLGQTVLTKNINDFAAEIDLSGLSAGIYLMKVVAGGGEKVVKICKN